MDKLTENLNLLKGNCVCISEYGYGFEWNFYAIEKRRYVHIQDVLIDGKQITLEWEYVPKWVVINRKVFYMNFSLPKGPFHKSSSMASRFRKLNIVYCKKFK